ncbi:MAG: hypothetical protein MI922_13675 [Bacteroidales bacterium]|nr:hypothetical protein [Bacteroidales bacterium]
MTEFDKFLSKLTNSELATFISYRFESYLENSKQKILKEVQKRKLSYTDLKVLYQNGIEVPNVHDYACPRCNSTKYYTETEYSIKQNKWGSREKIAIDTNRCRICDFNPAKSTQKGIINKIKQAFGLFETPRPFNPKIDNYDFH